MRNPDFIRLLNGFIRFQSENQAWIWKIKSKQAGSFFSEGFLNNFTLVIEDQDILLDFFSWIRNELLEKETVFFKFQQKYDTSSIIDFVLLLFYIQRCLEHEDEENLNDILERRKNTCLSEIIDSLSEHGIYIKKQLVETLERGYFPISSEGEILLFMEEVQTWVAKFLSFPSGNTITAWKKWEIYWIEEEEDDDIDGTQRDFFDWFFRDEDIENMDLQELETRIEIVKKWLDFHTWKWTILSRNEEFVYRKEYNTWYKKRGDEENYEEMTPESKRYYNSLFQKEIERILHNLERVYRMKKTWIQSVS